MDKMKIGKKIILFHKGGDSIWNDWISFDLLVHKSIVELVDKEVDGNIYKVDCDYVKKFLLKYPDYIYLGSEDFGHVYETNVAIFDFLLELISKFGWEKIDWEE
jgi:hypothetical protein